MEDGAPRVFNIFYLQNADGQAYGRKNDHALEVLRSRITRSALGDTTKISISQPLASKRAGAIPVPAKVRFPDTQRDGVSIIEIEGRDRPGLLYDIANCLHVLGLDLFSAHVEVVGEKAVDAFYVKGDLLDKTEQKKIAKALRAVLSPNSAKAAA